MVVRLLVTRWGLVLGCVAPGLAHGSMGEDQAPRIYGGVVAETCQWPTTVAMPGVNGLCSGTLVHPQIVLFAGHCSAPDAVRFGESVDAPQRTVPVDHCNAFGDDMAVGPDDYAYCKLAEPVSDIPVTPVVYGCETEILVPPQPVVIAGYGEIDQGSAGAKHWGETEIVAVTQMILVGKDGTSAWQGDSGGPAYVQYPQDGSWHAFGIVSGGTLAGMPVQYVPMHTAVPWVEMMSGVDITPCHDVDGSWNPTTACGAFATDPAAAGTWAAGCSEGDAPSLPSGTCGAPYVDDDQAPSVTITSPSDGDVFLDDAGSIDIEVDASDAQTGIRRVWVEIDEQDLGQEDTVEPYSFSSMNLPEGAHVIVAGAEDLSGNVAYSDPVGIGVGEGDGTDTGPDDDADGRQDQSRGCGCVGVGGRAPVWAWLGLGWLALQRRPKRGRGRR